MSNSKPVVIFIPRAWHSPECFAPTTKLVSEAGYPVVLIHSALLDPPADKIPDIYLPDVECIRAYMRDAISEGRKIVLFAHSFGGLVASAAVEGFEDHVIHLILCAAWMVPKGMAPSSLGTHAPWIPINEDKTLMFPMDPRWRFYHDVPEKEAEKAIATLKSFACPPGKTVTLFEGYRVVPTTYILCAQDQALPLEAQKIQLRLHAHDSGVETVKLNSSHSPFLSMPRKVAGIIIGLCGSEKDRMQVGLKTRSAINEKANYIYLRFHPIYHL